MTVRLLAIKLQSYIKFAKVHGYFRIIQVPEAVIGQFPEKKLFSGYQLRRLIFHKCSQLIHLSGADLPNGDPSMMIEKTVLSDYTDVTQYVFRYSISL